MENMIQTIQDINEHVSAFIWGPIMLFFFLLVGVMYTLSSGFFQFRGVRHWLGETIIACFRRSEVRKTNDAKSISQFQTICTSLAATIGTGNIAGVATAIVAGGPGAVFWMWVSAFIGMMTKFSENVLSVKYRYKTLNGTWVGGPMVVMEHVLGLKWLSIPFAVFCILASFGMGNMAQANSITDAFNQLITISPLVVVFILIVPATLVIFGGIKRIASFAETFVPFMAMAYLAMSALVLYSKRAMIMPAFTSIFTHALNLPSAVGGGIGYGISRAMRYGIARGVFSNEAGLGASGIVAAASDVKDPVISGFWGIFEVFVDTILICSVTALVILTSGVYDVQKALTLEASGLTHVSGAALVSKAFEQTLPIGGKLVSISIILFAFSTIIAWSYYGESAWRYLFGEGSITIYKLLYVLMIVPGCVSSLNFVWEISDSFNGLMAIPNLIMLFMLFKEPMNLLKNYLRDR
jgi:AGCS family alanine or glycine:cation symporter